MTTPTVYRSTHPDVLRIWHDSEAVTEEWNKRVEAFLDEHGLTGRNVYFNTASNQILGIEHHEGEEVPVGWRVERKHGYLTPRLATKEGKALDAQFDALRRPDPRDDVPGMPKNCLASGAFLTCGMREMSGALYVTWPRPIPESQVNREIWERVKLSEFYALVEAEEAAALAGGRS